MDVMKFTVYGIEVYSPENLPLLIPSEGVSDQVLRLEMKESIDPRRVLEYQTPIIEIHGRKIQLSSSIFLLSSRIVSERYWRINIKGLFSFFWSNDSDTMIVEYKKNLDLEKLSFWLLHTIIPIYLILKQSSLLLHASVVEVNNKTLLFVAPSFGGKSTLVDFFVKQKYSLLSDDKVRLDFTGKNYTVFPSYPYRRPYRKFEKLGDHAKYFSNKPLPLGNIYFLNYVDPKENCSIEIIQGLHKFEVLKDAYLYEPVSMSKTEMEHLLRLVHHSVLYQVNMPKDLSRLAEVYNLIIDHEMTSELQS